MGLIDYVNTRQGSRNTRRFSNGNTLPLCQMPFGMISFTSQTQGGSNWFFDPDIPVSEGLRLTHQPSPWIGDYGTLLFCPQADILWDSADRAYSGYRPSDAVFAPDEISLYMLRPRCRASVTVSDRCAKLRFDFDRSDMDKYVSVFNIFGGCGFEAHDGYIEGYTDGYQIGVANGFKMYVLIKSDSIKAERVEIKEQCVHVALGTECDCCELDVAISYISPDQAKTNLLEIEGRSFDAQKQLCSACWEDYLSAVNIDTEDEDERKTFYSCMYRTGLFPHKAYETDKNGDNLHYSPYFGDSRKGKRYTDNGFWDTYRTVFPLFSIIAPKLYRDVIEGALCDYEECGFLPRWVSIGEVGCMPSTLIDSVFAHAVTCKLVDDATAKRMLDAMIHHANVVAEDERFGRNAVDKYNEYGYVPCDTAKESVNLTLDFAYGDYCIAVIARALGENEIFEEYSQRAKRYAALFDAQSGFMRARLASGEYKDNFDPVSWGGDYTEASAWQTTFSVPHDLEGLAELFGGKEKLIEKLDELFACEPIYRVGGYSFEIHEMTEMATVDLGQCAISNQPSFLLPFIFAYFGNSDKTRYWVERICCEHFSHGVDGFPGDEDNGTTAAWYIFAKLGVYPVCPADDSWIRFDMTPKANITVKGK